MARQLVPDIDRNSWPFMWGGASVEETKERISDTVDSEYLDLWRQLSVPPQNLLSKLKGE